MLLAELQREFVGAVVNGAPAAALGIVGADAERRLARYRNNRRSNLRGALRSTYPVVAQLVGDEFFAYLADGFIDQYPSRSANLEDYGNEFAAFIAGFAAAQTLPYLADVARLELLIEQVLTAPAAVVTLASATGAVTCDGPVRLLRSPYPVQRIWQVNQPDWQGDAGVNLGEGPVSLLIRREDDEVLVETLPVAIEVWVQTA
jgi:hypothetical protein